MNNLNSKFRKGAIALVMATGLATTMLALAQPGPGFGPGMMGRGGPGMMMGSGPVPMFAANDTDFTKFQQDRLGQLKSQLNITAEQQPAWESFASKASEQVKSMQTMRKSASEGTMPERMQQRQQAMGERQKVMASMNETFTKLYDVLTPQQREVFDKARGPMSRRG